MSSKNNKDLDVENELTGREAEEALWAVIREAKSFTADTLWGKVNIRMATILVYLGVLEEGKYIWRDTAFEENRLYHRYTDRKSKRAPNPKRAAPVKPRSPALQNMWTVMRRLNSFTPKDVEVYAGTPEVAITSVQASNYCRLLLRTRYLKCVEKADPPHRLPRYRLIDDTGPLAPEPRRQPSVFDPNASRHRIPEAW
ncbi:MAG: hypothetical protein OQK05_00095 [Pseudopelagicola sp.]|nr:hypothetical protein [Pseudopelagicola sp.]